MNTRERDTAAVVWDELRRYLTSREVALMNELRHYPGPIARCDEQLPKLIEQRSAVRSELAAMDSADASPDVAPARVAFLRRFLSSAALGEDSHEAVLRSRAAIAVSASDAAAPPPR